jgi:cell division protein FtsQ
MADTLPVPFDVKLMNATANLVFALFALLMLAALAWWALRQPFFPLAGIRVDGDVAHNNAVTLRANVAPQLTGNFLTLDLARARAAFEAAPWVRRAVVRREFPNRLRVTLSEHEPVAHWGDEAGSRLIDSFGEVFDANVAEVDDRLPRLDGPIEQSAQVLDMYRALAPLFRSRDLSIDELSLSGRGSWRVKLDSGAALELGRGGGEEVAARTRRFLSSVEPVASQYGRALASVESADLRHNEGYALRLRGVTTVAPETHNK